MKITINYPKAEKVFGKLLELLREKQFPYHHFILPQNILPSNLARGSRAHALFLFCACHYMKGGIQSENAFTLLSRCHERDPELFRPEAFDPDLGQIKLRRMRERIFALLDEIGPGLGKNTVPDYWVYNMSKLHSCWNGDPTTLLGVLDYKKICARLIRKGKTSPTDPRGFYGFKEKMVSMLCYFYVDAGFVEPFVFPNPIDFHNLRVLMANDIIRVKEIEKGQRVDASHVLPECRRVTEWFCTKHSVASKDLSDALWLLSNSLCNQNPGNKSEVPKERIGRRAPVSIGQEIWSKEQIRKYWRSCGVCPVNSTCSYNIPSGTYYVQAKLVMLRRERLWFESEV